MSNRFTDRWGAIREQRAEARRRVGDLDRVAWDDTTAGREDTESDAFLAANQAAADASDALPWWAR